MYTPNHPNVLQSTGFVAPHYVFDGSRRRQPGLAHQTGGKHFHFARRSDGSLLLTSAFFTQVTVPAGDARALGVPKLLARFTLSAVHMHRIDSVLQHT